MTWKQSKYCKCNNQIDEGKVDNKIMLQCKSYHGALMTRKQSEYRTYNNQIDRSSCASKAGWFSDHQCPAEEFSVSKRMLIDNRQ